MKKGYYGGGGGAGYATASPGGGGGTATAGGAAATSGTYLGTAGSLGLGGTGKVESRHMLMNCIVILLVFVVLVYSIQRWD